MKSPITTPTRRLALVIALILGFASSAVIANIAVYGGGVYVGSIISSASGRIDLSSVAAARAFLARYPR